MRLRANRYRPQLECLEQRALPTASLQANVSNGYLYIQDSSPNDYISITQVGTQIAVSGIQIASGGAHVSSVNANALTEVVVYSHGGGCLIDMHLSDATQLTKSAYVIAYAGNNQIVAGSGNDTLYAYGGYNSLYAGSGRDFLLAYGGHNTLVAGSNYDVLYGYGGNNSLYGTNGTTVFISDAVSAPDTFSGGSGYNWYYRPIYPGQPFARGENVSDVVEGSAPLCQTDAALAIAAQQGVNFSKLIHYVGNNNYVVQLYGVAPQVVSFNGYYNDTDAAVAPGSESFWPILMMRARLQALGISPTGDYSTSQWNALNQSLGGRLYSVSDALAMFTGQSAAFVSMSQALPQALQSALANGHLVVASSIQASGVTADGIIGNHAYAVLSVYYQNGWKVRLYNPWGKDSLNGRTLDALQTGSAPRDDGYITLSWSQFASAANFAGYTAA
jgi:Ca2+-binding RTX toxin-like protein